MSNGETVDEPSMDEILSSIRKIIAEDEVEEPRAQAPASPPRAALETADEDVMDLGADDETGEDLADAADDFLELTAADETGADETGAGDATDDDLETAFEVAADAPWTESPDEEDEMAAESEPATAASPEAAVMMDHLTEVLLDSGAASAASGALQRLSAAMAPGAAVTGGNRSIETFLADLVRPELKSWLDDNLPPLVERIVEREIKKLVRDAQPE